MTQPYQRISTKQSFLLEDKHMTISRYSTTDEQALDDLDYKRVYSDKYDKNKREFLLKKETINIKYPEFGDILEFEFVSYVWSVGSSYYKLADLHYGDPRYWWVIAWFNKKPTESHCALGDIIRIPKPIGQVLTSLGY